MGRDTRVPATARLVHLALRCLGLLLVACAAGPASAQRTIGVEPPASRVAGVYADSWALVVGVNDYQNARVPKLRYAVNDARAVERALLAQGFRRERITVLTDAQATKVRVEEALGDRLRQQAGRDDRVLVFFAGHGMTVKLKSGEDEGYLIPVDGDPERLFSTAISMSGLRQISDLLPAKHVLYIVDACYSGYAVFNRATPDGLFDEMVKKPAIQILTAGRHGDQAQEKAGHGVFTDVLLRGLRGEAFGGKGWLPLDQLGTWVRERVYAESNGKQVPQFGNLSGDGQFVFTRPGAQVVAVPPPAPSPRYEGREEVRQELGTLALSARLAGVDVWVGDQKVWTSRPGSAYVVSNVPVGSHRIVARKDGHKEWDRVVEVTANQRAEVMIDIESLGPSRILKPEDGAEMVFVLAGDFVMGSDQADVDRIVATCRKAGFSAETCKELSDRERPRRRVTLDAFHIDKFEVTNRLFERFTRATHHRTTAEIDGHGLGWLEKDGRWQWTPVSGASWRAPNGAGTPAPADHPVVQVSWNDADAYCRWAGKRLPTEAEREKAARGPDGRRYPWGDEWDPSRANSGMLAGQVQLVPGVRTTTPVGSYATGVSVYGAYDLAGNVWEWVADWYDAAYYQRSPDRNPKGPDSGQRRSIRGGSWNNIPLFMSASYRLHYPPNFRNYTLGFRCARGES